MQKTWSGFVCNHTTTSNHEKLKIAHQKWRMQTRSHKTNSKTSTYEFYISCMNRMGKKSLVLWKISKLQIGHWGKCEVP